MSKIPLVASAEDLPSAISFAQLNTEARWFVASRADALKHLEDIPDNWDEKTAITASAVKTAEVAGFKAPEITDDEKKKIDADVADGHEENLPSAIVDPDKDGDDDLVASKDTDHDGAAYRKSLGLKAAAMLADATDFASLVAAGFYDNEYGVEDDYDNFDLDAEIPVTASGAIAITAAFTADQRKDYAKQGVALPDGSFPVPNRKYLKKAIRAVGRATDIPKAKAHIIKRAKALGAESVLPDDWKSPVTASTTLPENLVAMAKNALRAAVATDQLQATVIAGAHRDEKAALRERAGLPKADASESAGVTPVTAANVVTDIHKAAGDFEEALHPRGSDGKFITKGGRVVADDGAGHKIEGTVESIHAGLGNQAHIQIKTDSGQSIMTTANHVTNAPTAVAHLGESGAPHANPTTPQEHLANAKFHIDAATEHSDAHSKISNPTATENRAAAQVVHEHVEASKAHREAASQMMHSGGMTHSGEASFKPTGVETSGRHEGLATYAQPNAGTPRAGYKIPPRPEDLTPSHTGETVSPMGTSEVSKTRTADLRTEVDEFDKNPPSIRDGSAVYRARTTRYNEAKKELQSRQIPGARSGGTAGGGYNEGKNVDRDLAEDVGGKVTPQLRSDTEKAADAGAGQYSADEVRAAIERGKAAGPINRSSGPVHKAMSDEQLKAAKAEGDGYAHAELVSRAMKSHPDAKTAEGASTPKAKLRVTESSYAGEEGHTISGHDAQGRKVKVFTPAGREDADQVKKNIQEGKSAFAHRGMGVQTAKNTGDEIERQKQALRDRVGAREKADPNVLTEAKMDAEAETRAKRLKGVEDAARQQGQRQGGFEAQTYRDMDEHTAMIQRERDEALARIKMAPQDELARRAQNGNTQEERDAARDELHRRSVASATTPAGVDVAHQEAVVEQLKRMGYSDRTAKGVRNLTSKDGKTRIAVNDDGSFGMKVNRGDGVYSARKHGVDTSGDATSVAQSLHEAGKAAPAVKPHASKPDTNEANILSARKEVMRQNVARSDGTVPVYNVHTDKVEHVSPEEATAGHIRYGQSLGAGTPAAGQTVKNALDARQQQLTERAVQMFGSDRSKWSMQDLRSAAKNGDTQAAAALKVKLRAKAGKARGR